jgi:hypothetical protein
MNIFSRADEKLKLLLSILSTQTCIFCALGLETHARKRFTRGLEINCGFFVEKNPQLNVRESWKKSISLKSSKYEHQIDKDCSNQNSHFEPFFKYSCFRPQQWILQEQNH